MTTTLPVHVVGPTGALDRRLWRLRRRHDHLDSSLRQDGDRWELTYALNDRALLTSSFDTRDAAVADADARRRDLMRAGWTLHW